MTEDPLTEAVRLRSLAAWYRCWAALAANDMVRANRFRLAECLEEDADAVLLRGKFETG